MTSAGQVQAVFIQFHIRQMKARAWKRLSLTAEGHTFRCPRAIGLALPPGGSQELESSLAGVRGHGALRKHSVLEDDVLLVNDVLGAGAGEAHAAVGWCTRITASGAIRSCNTTIITLASLWDIKLCAINH